MDARSDRRKNDKLSFRCEFVGLRLGASPCGNAEKKSVPPAGIVESQFRPRNQWVSESHFPQSDPVSTQAVALGGSPLKRKTGLAGDEVDSSAEPESGGSAARRSACGRA